MNLNSYLSKAVEAIRAWEDGFEPFDPHPSTRVDEDALADAFSRYTKRLENNYPFFHPRYAGQMLKPPHPAAVVGYVAAMLINPNNHALDGGPATGEMEKEVVRKLAGMVHFPHEALGHLTSSGTIANLEALWIARELHPHWDVAVPENAHYTHERMGQVLGINTVPVRTDEGGRLDLNALEEVLKTEKIGTVVVTAGTTGTGAVDPIAEVLKLRQRYGCRVHVDAAYGGFFTLLARDETDNNPLSKEARRNLRAIALCDSVAIDPHKHGLQPYGCGCILFQSPTVGQFYKHDSPYTYFTSNDLHLGEISLECSRAGASAGALWLTLEVLPLEADDGFGQILSAGARAARKWHSLLEEAEGVKPFVEPELDIVTFMPEAATTAELDQTSAKLLKKAMHDRDEPVFLSLLRVEGERLKNIYPELEIDKPRAQILRSVLMKPEHEGYVEMLHAAVMDHLQDLPQTTSQRVG